MIRITSTLIILIIGLFCCPFCFDVSIPCGIASILLTCVIILITLIYGSKKRINFDESDFEGVTPLVESEINEEETSTTTTTRKPKTKRNTRTTNRRPRKPIKKEIKENN